MHFHCSLLVSDRKYCCFKTQQQFPHPMCTWNPLIKWRRMQAGLDKEARLDVSTGNNFNSVHVIWDGKSLWFQYSSPTKDSSLPDTSKWRTKPGYFGNWCLLQKQPGICSWASSNQQKPFHRHEWELEHALLAYCFKDRVCAVLAGGMPMRPRTSLFPA